LCAKVYGASNLSDLLQVINPRRTNFSCGFVCGKDQLCSLFISEQLGIV
jgi:hypothetical protein